MMKRRQLRALVLVVPVGMLILLSFSGVRAEGEGCDTWAGKAVSLQGTVEARRSGGTQWHPVSLDETFCPGDTIRVQKRSRAVIALQNQPVVHLDQNTIITLGGVNDKEASVLDFVKGAAHFFSRVARGLEVQTAFVNAGVEGTEFYLRVDDNQVDLSVFEGKVVASNTQGTLAVTSNQSVVAEAGKAPAMRILVRPRDAVQWALYYPPVISLRPESLENVAATWREKAKQSLAAQKRGDLAAAFAAIEDVPENLNNPRFLTYRASLLLSVGRVDEAAPDITRALDLTPNNSDAQALQAIIAITQNQKTQALELAQSAVAVDPQSATARVALSYAQQADFDLDGARASLLAAVELDPKNALAWARLAELHMSFAARDEALDAAQRAVDLNADLSRTQTVLGFAYLTRVDVEQARATFNKAITLDSADPLPRLGLGLAMIRQGDLSAGGREIEIAASLDPDNALIRSYLGKTYFEEKRDKQSGEELAISKQLDPADPTPFFYDAIRKQLLNRPVEALQDLQKATELNDNRAVFRSKLLLDADLAARSASLARIYNDLGFQQLALVTGWQSENTDPADFSGHRFLADSYAALPRHEIARVSQLLQSQLLQPLNVTPIQPHLAESNQLVLSSAGPADLSSNEFGQLFNRNGLALQANGLFGENETFSEEVVISGIQGKASFSLGQYYYETDGFRTNDDFQDSIANAFFQYSVSPDTSIQAEYRYRDNKKGDLTLRFLPDDYYPNQRQDQETQSGRLGFHHAFSPRSDLIGNMMYQSLDTNFHDSPDPIFVGLDVDSDQDSYGGELQHLQRWKNLKTIVGAGSYKVDEKSKETGEFLFYLIDPMAPPFPIQIVTETDIDIKHTNLYLYAHFDLLDNLTVTVGGSGDFTENDALRDEDQFNPKFGVTWNPSPETTLRAAYFRVLKRTLIASQTIEPTQVAGFNQFFDDGEGTDAWQGGVAVDQKLSENLFTGAEYATRNLTVPFMLVNFDPATGSELSSMSESDWDERLGRAYLYWTPSKRLSLSLEYLYEKFERGQEYLGIDRVRKVKTHRVPVAVHYFHPCGFSAKAKVTYFDQKGDFQPQGAAGFDPFTGNPVFQPGKDDFWLVDAAVSYRLPKRYGMITVGANNLFDQSFQYADMDPANPSIQPSRFIYARASIEF